MSYCQRGAPSGISVGVMHQELDYRRLERLAAVQREEWRLRQQWTDEERRQLTEAALEALKAVAPIVPRGTSTSPAP
jgi:hypothetical protein